MLRLFFLIYALLLYFEDLYIYRCDLGRNPTCGIEGSALACSVNASFYSLCILWGYIYIYWAWVQHITVYALFYLYTLVVCAEVIFIDYERNHMAVNLVLLYALSGCLEATSFWVWTQHIYYGMRSMISFSPLFAHWLMCPRSKLDHQVLWYCIVAFLPAVLDISRKCGLVLMGFGIHVWALLFNSYDLERNQRCW